ncbi:FlxA-like family protein [Desulfovibrio sp. Huiquan2017]|uniref:FlxA-like family protein n=1 Tax=Desulfovibrio sp. Huiquan2017 TaxID=2816861 RepID=UPI001A9206A1|nr:FlxA-like family protein [Desulfovibrio sp. Huiquan2017]
MAIESLMQQAGAFVDALTVKPAATDKTEAETAMEARLPDQGDTVTISEEGRALIAMEKPGESGESDQDSDLDQTIDSLRQRIRKLEKEIKALEKDEEVPDERKQMELQDKQKQLMELRNQLLQAQQSKLKVSGTADGGGTRANGFGNTAETF